MRLTVNLDPDLYAVAKSLARESDSSVGTAVNTLLRRALACPHPPATQDQPNRRVIRGKSGLPSVPCDRAFSSDDVYRIDSETA
jgi:hypothetical protein